MKHLLPSGVAPEQLRLRQRLQNIPWQEWKTNVIAYLRSVPWPQWGFVAVASFGFLVYLVFAFWLSVAYLLLGLIFHLTIGTEISESRHDENSFLGMVVRGIESFFVNIVYYLVPRRVWTGTGKRLRAAHIPRLMLRGAFALARPNRFTFAVGCAGLVLVVAAIVQGHLSAPASDTPSVPPYDAGDLNPEPFSPSDRPDPVRGANGYD